MGLTISRSSTAPLLNGNGATSRRRQWKRIASLYASGKSSIKRRYTVEHQFKNPGGFKIILRLKKGTKIIAAANAQVQVRAGLGQEYQADESIAGPRIRRP